MSRSATQRSYDRNRQREYRAKKRQLQLVTPEGRPDVHPLEVCEWMEKELKVATGRLAGAPFRIPEFQRRFLAGAMEDGIVEAGLSTARKNGKTGFIASVCLAHLVGPLNYTGWRCVVTSMTGILAKELLRAIQETAFVSGVDKDLHYRLSPPPGSVIGKNGAELNLLAADKATGHAVGADLVIIDEAGQMQENQRALWDAMYSCRSGRDGSMWSISIQSDGPMFAELEERASSPKVFFDKHTTNMERAIDDEDSWHDSNPALASGIKSMDYMREACERAMTIPANQPSFRALDLNQPVNPDVEMICSVTDYERILVDILPPRKGKWFLALDIGGSVSMSAAVAGWPETGRIELYGAFPSIPDLHIRGKNDAVGDVYERMHKRGELEIYPGRVVPPDAFLEDVLDMIGEGKPMLIAADRYKQADVLQAMDRQRVRCKVAWRNSSVHVAYDIRSFQMMTLRERWAMKDTLLMSQAIRDSEIVYKQNEPALEKKRYGGRIDILQAGIVAAGVMRRAQNERRGKEDRSGIVVV